MLNYIYAFVCAAIFHQLILSFAKIDSNMASLLSMLIAGARLVTLVCTYVAHSAGVCLAKSMSTASACSNACCTAAAASSDVGSGIGGGENVTPSCPHPTRAADPAGNSTPPKCVIVTTSSGSTTSTDATNPLSTIAKYRSIYAYS